LDREDKEQGQSRRRRAALSGIVRWEISKLVQLRRVEMDLADPEVVHETRQRAGT